VRGSLVYPFTQFLARLEVRDVLRGKSHALTRFRIPADPRGPEMQRETPEAPDFDAVSVGQRMAHALQHLLFSGKSAAGSRDEYI
ncbi:hypothetical protein RZS08_01150, partial [Arthrospira platensis SPKY1]|nr:hypothetical protein [Arthrospira platensis SPKY1]